ncbi:hypothetical protein [Cupriavidus sp. BIS7]|uniref:hypothetical protein n=1 Tax=Cupriavidus sp. BIS7 TaxID=1217718 RepID=UPI0012F640B0|nr:hypothetical protein [Cupriavidus sp. BIS7]
MVIPEPGRSSPARASCHLAILADDYASDIDFDFCVKMKKRFLLEALLMPALATGESRQAILA